MVIKVLIIIEDLLQFPMEIIASYSSKLESILEHLIPKGIISSSVTSEEGHLLVLGQIREQGGVILLR